MKKYGELYEALNTQPEVKAEAGRRNIGIIDHKTGSEFWSDDITMAGKVVSDYDREVLRDDDAQKWHRKVTEEIVGLRCPDCDAPAFKTDQKNVAVCGDYPGWYFFYRKVDNEEKSGTKMKLVLRGGQYVLVEDTDTDTKKEHV